MSIETEFGSTITNVKNAYQGLDNLGATIPQNKTIENIKNCLDEIYNNLPKTSYAEGSNITLSNTLKGKIDYENGIVGYGQAEQESTTGTNLANTLGYIAPTTTNGVTYSLENNIISLNGTATAAFYINFPGKFDLASGNYTFAPADISGTYTGVCGKYPCVNGTDIFDGNQLSTLVNRTLNSDYTDVFIRLFVSNGSSYSNYKCKLNLVKGTYTSQTIPTWEEYSGGYSSPSPNWEQDIEVVRGKNLCETAYNNQSKNQYTRVLQTIADLKPSTTYTISFKGTSGNQVYLNELLFNSSNRNVTLNGQRQSVTGTTKDTISTSNIDQYISPNGWIILKNLVTQTTETEITDVQIEEGSQATSYLPYNTIEVVERGKNWFDTSLLPITKDGLTISKDSEGNVIINGTSTKGSGYTTFTVSNEITLKAGTYTSSVKEKQAGVGISFSGVGSFNITMSDTKRKQTSTSVNDYGGTFVINIRYDAGTFTNYILNPQLESGSSDTTYEPYQTPQTYQLSLGEYEFAKIGNYVDTIEYDVENDKVYKNKAIGKYLMTGNENITTRTSGSIRLFELLGLGTNATQSTNEAINKGLSNCFIYHLSLTNNNEIRILGNDIAIHNDDYSDVATFKTWLATLNAVLYYILATATKEEITGTLKDQIKALYNSHSFTGTTIIEIDGNLPLIIKVRALKGE